MMSSRWSPALLVVLAGALSVPGVVWADKGGVPHAGSNGVGRDGVREEPAPAPAEEAAAPAEEVKPAKRAKREHPAKREKHEKRAHPAHPAAPAATAAPRPARPSAPAHSDNRNPGKTTICHRTGSATNPWVTITIADRALKAHARHGDLIPAPAGGCPAAAAAVTTAQGTGAVEAGPAGVSAPASASSAQATETPGAAAPSTEAAVLGTSASSTAPTASTSPAAASESSTAAPASTEASTSDDPAESAPVAAAAPATEDRGLLAYTGFPAWLLAIAGTAVLLAGVALRRAHTR
jgi:hypothetical protein